MDINRYYEEQGSGSPIVFIHGSYATTSTWKKMVDSLAENHHCICIKLPGHGGMPDPTDFAEPLMETELAIIEQLVRKLTTEPIHLVAHSFGGVIALAQLLKGSLEIAEITLFEPVAVWLLDRVKDDEMLARVDTFLHKYRQDAANNVPHVGGQVIDFWGGAGAYDPLPDFIKESMAPLVSNNIRHWDLNAKSTASLEDLNRCKVPMRVVYGSESNPVAKAICQHLAQQVPKCTTYTVDGASHFLVTTHPRECVAAMTA
jgi:pimeloyl-ACP methyl ester carboxylesterase